MPAQHHETQGAGDRDWKTTGRRSGHRLLYWQAAPGQEWHGQRPAADPKNGRRPADHRAGQGQATFAGNAKAGLGLEVQGHLQGDHQGEDTNDLLQQRPLDRRSGLGAKTGPDQDTHGHPDEDRPLHRAFALVLADGVDGSEHDGGQRGTHGQVRQYRCIETLQGETEHQHRHDNDATTDAEQPSQYTGTAAEYQIEQKFHCRPPNQSGMVTEGGPWALLRRGWNPSNLCVKWRKNTGKHLCV
ncbi:hypothetical protein D3C76_836670 [compost metagenome]